MFSTSPIATALAASLALVAGSAAAQSTPLLGGPTFYKVGLYDQCLDLQVGDLDGNGKLDLVVVKGPDVKVLRGYGGAEFGAPTVAWTSYPSWSEAAALADFDGDGRLDLAVAARPDTVSVLLGRGDGTFGPATSYTVNTNPQGLMAADLSGDGVPDLAVACDGSPGVPGVSVLINLGGGAFGPATNYNAGFSPKAIAVGDFNADGLRDVVISGVTGQVQVLPGQGGGGFGPPHSETSTVASYCLAVADFDADNRPDLVLADYSSGVVAVMLGEGYDAFGPPKTYHSTAKYVASLAVADLDGDGFLDVALGSSGTHAMMALAGKGTGDFVVAKSYPLGQSPRSVVIADFSGDGTPDVAVADLDDKTVAVMLNQGPNGDPWTYFGFGLAGSSGIPALTATGSLVGGTATTMTLSSARPQAFAALYISIASHPTPFKAGALVTVPVLATLFAATDDMGSAQWVWPAWPTDVSSGLSLYFQCAIADPAAPRGMALSSALQAVSP